MVAKRPGLLRCGCESLRQSHWERTMVIAALSGCLWLSIIMAGLLTLQRVEVPRELYYLGTAAFGGLAVLLKPTAAGAGSGPAEGRHDQ